MVLHPRKTRKDPGGNTKNMTVKTLPAIHGPDNSGHSRVRNTSHISIHCAEATSSTCCDRSFCTADCRPQKQRGQSSRKIRQTSETLQRFSERKTRDKKTSHVPRAPLYCFL